MNPSLLKLLEKLLFDTLSIDFHYFPSPFDDISASDRHLREGLDYSEDLYSELLHIFNKVQNNKFYLIEDRFLLNYIIFRPFQDKNDIICLGPYTNRPVNDDFFNEIIRLNHLSISHIKTLKSFFYGIPLFDNNLPLIAVINDILDFVNSTAEPFEIIDDFSLKEKVEINKPFTAIEDFEIYANSVQKRYEFEEELLEHIAAGNQLGALLASKHIINMPFEQRLVDSLQDKKALLNTLNTLLRKGAQRSEVHPVHLHEISSKYVREIEQIASIAASKLLHEKMIRDYCLLVKNKARIQYCPLIRNTINQIELNLDSPLSLARLAQEMHVSSPYLSGLFKKETGQTITNYINQQRILASLKLLNASSMPIQDIASYVGIHDLNYFTKVFKKTLGCTPSIYRKKIRQNENY